MCLAKPLKVVGVEGKKVKVDSEGEVKVVDAAMLSGVKKGDYLLVHGSLAIQKLDRGDAKETLRLIEGSCNCNHH